MIEIPFHILKRVITIQDTHDPFVREESGWCFCVIEGYRVKFHIDSDNEIIIGSIRCIEDTLLK